MKSQTVRTAGATNSELASVGAEPEPSVLASDRALNTPVFELNCGGLYATAELRGGKFWIKRGSPANRDSDKFDWRAVRERKVALIRSAVLKFDGTKGKYIFQQDTDFESPSAAASFVCGSNRNGRKEWKVKGTVTTFAQWEAAVSRGKADKTAI